MKLHVMSDLHLEFFNDGGKAFVEGLDPCGADTLVLAGDITTFNKLMQAMDWFSAKSYERIMFVPGNHEYYGLRRDLCLHVLDQLILTPHIFPLMDGLNSFGRFVGGTLWFSEDAVDSAGSHNSSLNDFRVIDRFEQWVYGEHGRTVKHLQEFVEPESIVVTHHLPHPKCIAPQYKDDPLNPFFMHDCSDIIESKRPKLWIHGHTHSSVDTTVGDTRIVCNPFGYWPSDLNPDFDPRKIIEI